MIGSWTSNLSATSEASSFELAGLDAMASSAPQVTARWRWMGVPWWPGFVNWQSPES